MVVGGGELKKKKDLMALSIWLYLVSESVLTTDLFIFFHPGIIYSKNPDQTEKLVLHPHFWERSIESMVGFFVVVFQVLR